MTGKELMEMTEGLEEYLRTYDHLLGRAENRRHFRRFARGQLGAIERKSLEPIADAEGIAPRLLQFFFSSYTWDEEGVRDRLQQKVAAKYGGEDGIFIVDETSDAKKGQWTAGVARQYCGESGKIDNCIVSVHLAYARGNFYALLDGELFLPESWDANRNDEKVTLKRRRAQIPDEVGHESKAAMALRQLERAKANGVPGRYVTGDETYGGKPWWRAAVGGLEMIYVVEVPKSTCGWVGGRPRMEVASYSGRGRPATRPVAASKAKSVEGLANSARGRRLSSWQRFRVHNTQKGPEVWEVRTANFWERGPNAPAALQRLLIARSVRTGEVKYFLTNAPADVPLKTLVRVAFSRWRIERCFEDCKSQLGLNHAEIRTYRGLHRHFILTAVNYFFLQDWLLSHCGGEKARPDRKPASRRHTGVARAKAQRYHEPTTTAPSCRAKSRMHPKNPTPKPTRTTIGNSQANPTIPTNGHHRIRTSIM